MNLFKLRPHLKNSGPLVRFWTIDFCKLKKELIKTI